MQHPPVGIPDQSADCSQCNHLCRKKTATDHMGLSGLSDEAQSFGEIITKCSLSSRTLVTDQSALDLE